MATIGSTTDLTSYVSQLVDLERQQGPEAAYKQQQQDLTNKNATLTDLQTDLGALNSQVQALMQPGSLSPLGVKAATSSNSGVLTATASPDALNGTHTLLVTQLAKRSSVVSSQVTQTGTDLATAVGAGEQTFRITVNGAVKDVTVSIGAADDNQTILANIATAINGADAGVTASVVNDSGSTARLVITSDDTGSANAVTLADQSGTLLAALGANSGIQASGTTGGAIYTASQLDAVFSLDGLSITRGSNSVGDVLTGVTLNLAATQDGGATPVTLTVGPDQSAVQSKVQAFLDAYNTVVKFLRDRTGVTVTTSAASDGSSDVQSVIRGTLASDPTYLGLMMNLRLDAIGQSSSAASAGPHSLSEIGITAGSDGTLSISDTTKFSAALTQNADGVMTLFNSSDGIATRVSGRLSGFVSTGGVLDNSMAAITSQLSTITLAIQQQEDYLKVRQDTLLQQYTTLQQTLYELQNQQDMITAYYGTSTSSTTSF